MKKHFLLFFLLSFLSFLQVEANENAVKIEATNLSYGSGTSYSVRFDDMLLGEHEAGSVSNDSRTREFTISAWIKTTKQQGHIMGLVQAEQWTDAPSFCVRFNGGKLELFSRTKNDGSFPDENAIKDLTEETLTVDEWAFVTIVISNNNNKISLYKNATLVTEDEFKGNQGAGLLGDASVFFIGNQGFEGAVSEIQLWNKVLSAEEIMNSMKQKDTSDNLIYHYYFDGTETNGMFPNKGTGGECNAEYSKLTVQNQGWYTSVSATATTPTFVEGRTATIVNYTVTLPTEISNGTLTVMKGETPLTIGENIIEEGATLTITATPAEGYVLDYLKINGESLTENTYTVTENAIITVAFIKKQEEATSKAIHVPANNGNTKYQFRFDDIVLGEHVNGTNNKWENGAVVNKGDNRARNFTMSVWIKPLNTNTGELFGHAQSPYYGAQGTFGVSINNSNQLVLKARAWINEGQCDGISDLSTTGNLEIGQWAFLTVAVDDDAREIKLYKNGELIATGDLSQTGNGTEAHGIGLLQDECVFFAGNGGASCDVDEVQIWNKTLSAAEIAASMEGYVNAPENLIAFYKFDENSIENMPNQGTGVACNAELVSGTTNYQGSPYWAYVYTSTPIQATLVDGHILPKFVVNYVSETDHGSFVIKNGDNIITSGSKVPQYTTLTVEATPIEGYQVKSIKVNNTEIEGNTFVLNEEATVTVEFSNKLTINYTVSGMGSFSVIDENNPENPFNNGDEFERNTSIKMVMTAGEGYEIFSFTVNGEEQKESINTAGVYTIANCQTDLDINVVFAKKQFNVTFSSNDFGTLVVKKGSTVIESNALVEYQTELTITVKPAGQASLTTFTINGIDKLDEIKNTLTMNITVTEKLDIRAEFFIPNRAITCNITGNGSVQITDDKNNIYENGVASIPNGANIILTFIPETGYQLDDFTFEGESLFEDVIDNKYDFTNIDDNYTFDVIFTKITSIYDTSAEPISVRYKSGTLYVDEMNVGDRLDIYNITGSYIRTSVIAKTDVSDLPNGCYLVKVSIGNVVKTVKFIKR